MKPIESRDEKTMRDWVHKQTTTTLRACRAEAEREGDHALVVVIDVELRERGER